MMMLMLMLMKAVYCKYILLLHSLTTDGPDCNRPWRVEQHLPIKYKDDTCIHSDSTLHMPPCTSGPVQRPYMAWPVHTLFLRASGADPDSMPRLLTQRREAITLHLFADGVFLFSLRASVSTRSIAANCCGWLPRLVVSVTPGLSCIIISSSSSRVAHGPKHPLAACQFLRFMQSQRLVPATRPQQLTCPTLCVSTNTSQTRVAPAPPAPPPPPHTSVTAHCRSRCSVFLFRRSQRARTRERGRGEHVYSACLSNCTKYRREKKVSIGRFPLPFPCLVPSLPPTALSAALAPASPSFKRYFPFQTHFFSSSCPPCREKIKKIKKYSGPRVRSALSRVSLASRFDIDTYTRCGPC